MADNNQGSFVTGLALGLFAGAASYFMLATPKGKKMRQKLEKEWQTAQEAGEPIIPEFKVENINMRGLFATLKTVLVEASEKHKPVAAPAHKPKKAAPKKHDGRFKGV